MAKSKWYGNFLLEVDDYKENGKVQFNLNTKIPDINTNLDFDNYEKAFEYADKVILDSFSDIISSLKK